MAMSLKYRQDWTEDSRILEGHKEKTALKHDKVELEDELSFSPAGNFLQLCAQMKS